MKLIKRVFLLFSSFLFLGCVTAPAGKILKTFPHEAEISKEENLRFIFPAFVNEESKIIPGDGSIVIFPDNKIMVIDGFDPKIRNQFTAFIKELGYSKIDYLVATHFHGDHIGGFPSLMENFEIGSFYSPGAPISNYSSERVLKLLKEKNIPEYVLKEGDELEFGKVHMKVFSPNLSEEDIYNVKNNPGKTAKLINNTSLVFKLSYKDFSIMYTADVYKNREREICRKYGKELKSNLLKVSHHADFYTANSYAWLSTVQPDYGIVIDNLFINRPWGGYVIRNRFSLNNILLLYNNSAGVIMVESDGKEYSISCQ